MVNVVKKAILITLTFTLALGVMLPSVAASSPSKGKKPVDKKNIVATKHDDHYNIHKTGKATLIQHETQKKSDTVPETIKYKKVKYKVTEIAKNAFKPKKKKNKKLKTIKIKGNIKRIRKHAFKGSKINTVKFTSKKVVPKIDKGAFSGSSVKKIYLNKKMSKKKIKDFKNKLKKSGFKGTIIVR